MRSILILQLVLLTISTLANGQHKEQFRVISYNIWNGFDWGKDTTRAISFQRWMNEQDSDVAALQELCGYTQAKLLDEARKWNHPYVALLKKEGYSVGLTSKYPVEIQEKIFDGMHHGAMHCKVKGIDFLIVHLHPGSIKRRREEMRILLRKIEEILHSTARLIVLGDFNAHSPFDAHLYDPDGYFINRLKESNQGKGLSGNLVDDGLDYAVMSGFLSSPLYDVVRTQTTSMAERGSFPAIVLGAVTKESREHLIAHLERIDYILVSEELAPACVGARICNGEENGYLSDHYPVIADFILEH